MMKAKDLRRGSVIFEGVKRVVVRDVQPCHSRHKVHVVIEKSDSVWCYDREQEVMIV